MIPNYDDNSTAVIKPGMTFAIEPFATNGNGLIYEAENPTIYSQISDKRPLKSDLARRVLATVKMFQGLPFSVHDLLRNGMNLVEVKLGVAELHNAGVILEAPSLHPKRATVLSPRPKTLVPRRYEWKGIHYNPLIILMDKKEVARIFEEIAVLLELKAANPFRIRAYRNAVRAVLSLDEDLGKWSRKNV